MNGTKALSVTKELKGMSVLNSRTGERLGEVEDVIVEPTRGRVLGLLLRGDGEARALGAQDFFIGPDAVMAAANARLLPPEQAAAQSGGVPARELTGTNIVTADGKLIGRVSEVYISLDEPKAAYHVTQSSLQRFFGGGFYLAGDVPRAYSSDGARMIVPEDTEHRAAVGSLNEALGIGQTATEARS